MRFWDSSAILPLILEEESTRQCQKLFKEDSSMLVWSFTITEIYSAIYRRFREISFQEQQLKLIRQNIQGYQSRWTEVLPTEQLKQIAHRLLAVHSLRAADSLQLAAALVAFKNPSTRDYFISLDHKLSQAASLEGFQVIT